MRILLLVFDVNRPFGAIGGAEPRLILQLGRHLLDLDHAATRFVVQEHVRRQRVAAAVSGAETRIDPHPHRPETSQTSGRSFTSRIPGVYVGTRPGLIW